MNFEIISANYNNSKFLNNFFDSIINSSVKPSTIIIIDDNSQDNSVEIIESYADKINIKLIKNKSNLGFANSLNIALKELKEPYFARLDPDDEVRFDRFSKQLTFLKENPDIDIVGTNVSYVLKGQFKKNSDVPINKKVIAFNIRKGILPIIHGSIMGKTRVLNGFKYRQEFVPSEDYDLFAYLISKQFQISNLIDTLTLVTIHENSVSSELKFTTIVKRFKLAEEYFNFKKSILGSYFEYIHQFYYRKYLIENSPKKYFYIFISASVMPIKVIKKFYNI